MTITESYFGQEVIPLSMKIIDDKEYYFCELDNRIVVYDENGSDPMGLSNIDINEFKICLKERNE